MGVDEVVSQVGLWWPAADEDGLRDAAQAWARTAAALDQAVDVGRAGAARASAQWAGDAAQRFAQAWHAARGGAARRRGRRPRAVPTP